MRYEHRTSPQVTYFNKYSRVANSIFDTVKVAERYESAAHDEAISLPDEGG